MNKPLQTILFYKIFNFPRKVKSGFAPKTLSFLKKSCPDDAIVPLNAAHFSAEEKTIDDFFSTIHSSRVEKELYKWFNFDPTEKGKHFADLTPVQLNKFVKELPLLIFALYNYHQARRKEVHRA